MFLIWLILKWLTEAWRLFDYFRPFFACVFAAEAETWLKNSARAVSEARRRTRLRQLGEELNYIVRLCVFIFNKIKLN